MFREFFQNAVWCAYLTLHRGIQSTFIVSVRALVVATFGLLPMLSAFANEDPIFVVDSSGKAIRTGGSGDCLRTSYWVPYIYSPSCENENRPPPPTSGSSSIPRPPPPPVPLPVPIPPTTVAPKVNANVYPLWYATNRKPELRNGVVTGYTADFDKEMHFGKLEVIVTDDYLKELYKTSFTKKVRMISAESLLQVGSPISLTGKSFIEQIKADLSPLPKNERIALIYIHGFKTTFIEAAQRSASIGYQLKIPSTTFFSWPSKGTLADYVGDLAQIERSEEDIAQFLVKFVRESGAAEVHLIAHSMGNWGLLRAMYRPFMQAALKKGLRFGQVILAAPDVDMEKFKQDAIAYKAAAKRITLYASSNDEALKLSGRLRSFTRAGSTPPILEMTGIDTVDVGAVNLTLLGHSYVSEEVAVLGDMFDLTSNNTPPAKRFRLRRNGAHWEMR